MKTPAASLGIYGLVLIMACASAGLAQNAASQAVAVDTHSDADSITIRPNDTRLTPPLSRPASEIVRLTQSGIDESVVLSFIANSATFSLLAEHLIYLNDLGVSPQVINAMLAHDRQIVARQSELANAVRSLIVTNQNPVVPAAPPNTLPALPQSPIQDSARATNDATTTEITRSVHSTNGNPLTLTTGVSPSFAGPQSPRRPKLLYPVREPHPVEITAPIVFLAPPTF